jgi:hypothetical protein
MKVPLRCSPPAAALVLLAAAACTCAGAGVSGDRTSRRRADDVVVTEEHWSRGLTVPVGQTFRIPRPLDVEQWAVSYARNVVRMLTPADRAARPGPEGWRFEAMRQGSTDITMSGAPDDGARQPNVPKLVLQVRVSRR